MGTRSGGAASRQASSLLRPTSTAIMVAIAAGRITQQEIGRRLGVDADTAEFVRAMNGSDFKKTSTAFMKVAGKATIAGAAGFVVAAGITYAGFKLADFANRAARTMSPGEAGAYFRTLARQNLNVLGRTFNFGEFVRAAAVWGRNAARHGYYDSFTRRFYIVDPNSYGPQRSQERGRTAPPSRPATPKGPAEAREARPNTTLPTRVSTADLRRLMSEIDAQARRDARGQ